MNDTEVNALLRRQEHERTVESLDATALRAALLGTPTALDLLAQGVVITIADCYELDQTTIAAGLSTYTRKVQRRIESRRTAILDPRRIDLISDAVHEPVEALIEAVGNGDGATVAAIFRGYDRMEMSLLVLVLIDRIRRSTESGATHAD